MQNEELNNRLKLIDELLAKITGGNWVYKAWAATVLTDDPAAPIPDIARVNISWANGDFIAAAPETIRFLLSELRKHLEAPHCPTCGAELLPMASYSTRGGTLRAFYCLNCSKESLTQMFDGPTSGFSMSVKPLMWHEQTPPACVNCGSTNTRADLDEYSERPFPKWMCEACGHIWEVK